MRGIDALGFLFVFCQSTNVRAFIINTSSPSTTFISQQYSNTVFHPKYECTFSERFSKNKFVSQFRQHEALGMAVIDVDVVSDDDNNNKKDDEEEEIGTMKVSDIKAELKLRGVDFSDCFDKESLAIKLRDARAAGMADPSIVDNFNRQQVRL